jgi:O-antigen/teichoic acid export membrane protein
MDSEKKNEAEINTGLKFIAKSSIIVFVGVFLSKFITYIYRIVIARYFDPEVYGLYSLASIVLNLFVVVSSIGLIKGLERFVPFYRGQKKIDKIKYLIKTLKIILIFSSIFFGAILYLSSSFISINIFHNENLTSFLKIFSILVPLTNLSYIFLHTLRVYERIASYSFIWNILQNFVKVGALILFIFWGLETNAIIFSYSLGILSMLLVAYILCRFKLPEIFKKYKLKKEEKSKIKKEVFFYSWPLMFSSLIMVLFYWIDSLLLGYFIGVGDVGIYNAATPLVGLMSFFPAMFAQFFLPLIAKEFGRKKFGVIKELSKQVGKWIFILNLPLFFIMFLFPTTLIRILFGEQYILASSVLQILAVGGFVSSLVFLSTDLISMIGKSKMILVNIICASILNVFLNIILIPKYGLNGAAIATAITTILLSILLLIEVKYYVHLIPLRKKIFKIFVVSLVPLLLLVLIKKYIATTSLTLILLGSFFLLSYALLLLLTKSLDKNDILILKSLKRKPKNTNSNKY